MSIERTKAIMMLLDNIIDKEENGRYTRATFKTALSNEELPSSDGFVTKVRNHIKDLGIDIAFDESIENRIRIVSEDIEEMTKSIYRLQGFLGMELLSSQMKGYVSLVNYVQSDFTENTKGFEWLSDCMAAIKERKKLTITHKRFEVEDIKTREDIVPLFLKEYNNRWYLVVQPVEGREYMIYGLDRITKLKLQEETFELKEPIDFALFNDVIGIDRRDEKALVRICCDREQMNYIKITPLHHSQKVIKETNEGMEFTLEVRLNHELKRVLLSYGSHLKVLEPESLRFYMKEELEKSLKNY